MKTDIPKKVDFRKPPWFGQTVKMWIRVLARVWVIVVALIAPFALWLSLQDGIPKEDTPSLVGFVALEMYATMSFAHVALRGYAPERWFSWRRPTKPSM